MQYTIHNRVYYHAYTLPSDTILLILGATIEN